MRNEEIASACEMLVRDPAFLTFAAYVGEMRQKKMEQCVLTPLERGTSDEQLRGEVKALTAVLQIPNEFVRAGRADEEWVEHGG